MGTATPVPRKLLSDQLDRFDLILDGLADGLNDAIADAAPRRAGPAPTDTPFGGAVDAGPPDRDHGDRRRRHRVVRRPRGGAARRGVP